MEASADQEKEMSTAEACTEETEEKETDENESKDGNDEDNDDGTDNEVDPEGDGEGEEKDGSPIAKEKTAVSDSSASSKFFKSSFTAVSGASGPSILDTLSAGTNPGTIQDRAIDEEYDPAHPTDELEDDDDLTVVGKVNSSAVDDDKYDPAHPTDELDDVSEEEMETENNQSIVNETTNENDSESDGKKTVLLGNDEDKDKEISRTCNKESAFKDSDNILKNKDSNLFSSAKSSDQSNSSEIEEFPLSKEPSTPEKSKKLETNLKISPSVKITETGKKVSPSSIKPFEISKKMLYEKKRLYGGEIDFSEDVSFTDAGFENFEVNIKAIESVFKGTVSKPDEKVEDQTQSKEDKKVDQSQSKQNDVKENEASNIQEKENEMEKKEKSKTKDENLNSSKKSTPLKSKSDKNKNKKEKLTVSDRFKMLEDSKQTDIASLEEEDPIHEMRKLDKELDLELGNPDVGKTKSWHKGKSDSDKEYKKSKRKVSIDRDEAGKVRHRKDGKDKKQDWEEVEEGEVEDERQYRERKRREKREKKKKAAEKEKYYDEMDSRYEGGNPEADAEIDTRLVVQVSQNTDSRTVWEEDEKIRKKKDKEERERRKEKRRDEERVSKKDKKRKRRRSRSRSYDRHDKSKSRERKRSRSRSRDRSKRRHRDRSRSRSVERSRKKKKKGRDRSWDRRSRSRSRSRSRERSEDRVDMFGRSRSPFRRKERESLSPVSPVHQPNPSPVKKQQNQYDVFKIKRPRIDGEVILIDDDDDDDEDENMHENSVHEESNHGLKMKVTQESPKQPSLDSNSRSNSPKQVSEHEEGNADDTDKRESSLKDISSDERDEFSDEPEETEQFNYTDRDEFHIQNKHKQQHQNLIQVGVEGSSYDPANPTESLSPGQPPLPDEIRAPVITPPLPPSGEFAPAPPLFPPPPPGHPPPPPTVFMQDRPPEPPQLNGPPGPRLLGDPPPLMMQGPPPPIDQGPPPQGLLHQRPPNISVPININVVPPPGFHRGLPQTIQPQRQIIVNAFRPGMPRLQTLPSPNVPRFGFTTSAEVVTPQFGLPSHPRPDLIGGPYDGLPPPTEGPPPNLPPPHSHFAMGADLPPPPQHMLPLHPDGPPPSNLVQIPVEMEDPSVGVPLRPLLPPVSSTPNSEPPLVHLGPMSEPPPRLPIPLLPTSDPIPPQSVMVSLPPPSMSMPPPDMVITSPNIHNRNIPPLLPSQNMNAVDERFIDNRTPPSNHINSGRSESPIGNPVVKHTTVIPGLDMVEPVSSDNKGKPRDSEKTFSQLEEISKLLTTQAKLMLVSKKDKPESDGKKSRSSGKDDGVFKVPLPPGTKSLSGKSEIETTEVIDMDMASPILGEGNIELPVSPQFDNLIDTDDWLEEVYEKEKKKSESEKQIEKQSEKQNEKQSEKTVEKEKEAQKETKKPEQKIDLADKWLEIINSIPVKPVDTSKDKTTDKLNKTEVNDSKKGSTPVKLKDGESKKDSPAKKGESKKHSSKENKHKVHQHRKHRHKKTKEENLKQKAQVDTELDLDSQELTSAVDMTNKEKYLRKLHLQERVVEEVKMAIKPHYAAKKIDKDQYKEIMRKAVPKICHSKSGDINPMKIKSLIEAYVDRYNKHAGNKNSDNNEPSPSLKANGERAKTKAGR